MTLKQKKREEEKRRKRNNDYVGLVLSERTCIVLLQDKRKIIHDMCSKNVTSLGVVWSFNLFGNFLLNDLFICDIMIYNNNFQKPEATFGRMED